MSTSVELTMNGRAGNLRFIRGGIFAEVDVEMSGSKEYDLLVWTDWLLSWSDGSSLSQEECVEIKNAFISWAEHKNIGCQW